MIQVDVRTVKNQGEANEILRAYPQNYPKRTIISISMMPIEFPGGWFMTITYKL